jgi:hypothetical protein
MIVVALATAQGLGLLGGGSPTIASPVPVPLAIPIFFGVPRFVVPAVCALLFLAWISPLLITGDPRPAFPIRSWVLLGLVAGGSLYWYRMGWSYGLEFEGPEYTLWCAILSGTFFVSALLAAAAATRWRYRVLYVVAHTLAFCWASTYAFPWLGETP